MSKQFIISVVALFIWTMAMGFLIHGWILAEDYAALPNVYRSMEESQGYFGYMLAGHLSLAVGLTWVYRMGKQDKPWLAQGFRFGIALVFLLTISYFLIYYAVLNIPAGLAHQQLIYETVAAILTGIVAAFVNK